MSLQFPKKALLLTQLSEWALWWETDRVEAPPSGLNWKYSQRTSLETQEASHLSKAGKENRKLKWLKWRTLKAFLHSPVAYSYTSLKCVLFYASQSRGLPSLSRTKQEIQSRRPKPQAPVAYSPADWDIVSPKSLSRTARLTQDLRDAHRRGWWQWRSRRIKGKWKFLPSRRTVSTEHMQKLHTNKGKGCRMHDEKVYPFFPVVSGVVSECLSLVPYSAHIKEQAEGT